MGMKWTDEAESAIRKVPFFVRKKVRARVEKEAGEAGQRSITLKEVNRTRDGFLKKMDSDIAGFQVDGCFSGNGCSNRITESQELIREIEKLFREADIVGFLRDQVDGPLKYHHEFRVSVSDCPNACSQPQIKDIGIIGAVRPELTDSPCAQCGRCVFACREGAATLDESMTVPAIDHEKCLSCDHCVKACPTGTLRSEAAGYRVLLGGRLGRRPRLALEIPGIKSEARVLEIVSACIDFYKSRSRKGKRFSHILGNEEFQAFVDRFGESL